MTKEPVKMREDIQPSELSIRVGKALQAAHEDARKTAKMYGTPMYYWRDGKVVAEKP